MRHLRVVACVLLVVFAVAVTVADPGALATKRQSSRRSAPLVSAPLVAACVPTVARPVASTDTDAVRSSGL